MESVESEAQKFNAAAARLQQSEFRTPQTPGEWQRAHKAPPKREYTKLFDAVLPLSEAFVSAGPAERRSIAERLSPDALGILRTFAHEAAVLAVRRESPRLIAQGLTVVAILGEVDDARDLSFYLATLYHVALKLGIDAPSLFAQAAALCSGFIRGVMESFPLLPPRSRSLAAFNLREVQTGDGYDITSAATL